MALHGFIEIICEHAGVIRAGPTCHTYGDPYELAVAYSVSGRSAIIKGLVSSDRKFSREYLNLTRKLLADIGLEPEWERYKATPHG